MVTSFYDPRAPFPLSRLSSERPPIEIAVLAVFQNRPGICQFVPFDHRPPPTDLRLPPPFLPAVFLSFVSGLRYHSIYGFVHPLLPSCSCSPSILHPRRFQVLSFSPPSPPRYLFNFPLSDLTFSSFYFCSLFLSAFLSLPLLLVANLPLRSLIYRYLFLVPCQPYPAAEILLSIARQKNHADSEISFTPS